MTFQIGDIVKINNEKILQVLVGEKHLDIEFKIYLFDKDINPEENSDLVLIKPKEIYIPKINNICGVFGNRHISTFYLDEASYNICSVKSNLFERTNFGELFIWIPEDCLSLIQNKIKKSDGCFCIHCHNFSSYAENNYREKFLCWSCNIPMNKIIYGLD